MRRATIHILAALVVLVAACGDDGAEEPAGTTAPTTTQAVTTTEAATTTAAATTEATTTTAAATTTVPPETTEAPDELTISSPAFGDGDTIPEVFSCNGDNVSPELVWANVPAGTTSLVLVMDDPDADGFVHWVAWNIPPESGGLPQDVPAGGDLPDGTRQAANDFAEFVAEGELTPGGAPWKVIGYDGPCPGGAHTYVFTLYALTGTIDLGGGTPGADIIGAVDAARADGSLIGEASLTGLYGPG